MADFCWLPKFHGSHRGSNLVASWASWVVFFPFFLNRQWCLTKKNSYRWPVAIQAWVLGHHFPEDAWKVPASSSELTAGITQLKIWGFRWKCKPSYHHQHKLETVPIWKKLSSEVGVEAYERGLSSTSGEPVLASEFIRPTGQCIGLQTHSKCKLAGWF